MKLTEMVPDNRVMKFTLVVLFIGLFLLRVPDMIVRPQFWAEDGTKFFRYAACFGTESLLTTHAGYYHLIPRLTALFAASRYFFIPLIMFCWFLAIMLKEKLFKPAAADRAHDARLARGIPKRSIRRFPLALVGTKHRQGFSVEDPHKSAWLGHRYELS